MSYCVFIHRTDSIYDDSPAERYQFPQLYLGRAQPSVGNWVVYLEPSKVPETRGYFAIARVQKIIPDPKAPGMHLAVIEPGSYLPFANQVPFNDGSGPLERGLLNEEGRMSGRAQSAVRPISAMDFNRILERGLREAAAVLPRLSIPPVVDAFEEGQTPFIYEQPRDVVQQLVSRPLRDRVFRQVVLRAYGERCSVTGLKLINGGGRAEVNAAHIRPVAQSGPDIVNNGIAMSGTAHWMFDRGLIGLSDELEIMISRYVNDQDSVRGFINRSGFAVPPEQARDRPHPRFLQWHRENTFKQ
jgi:putative restriction endonuclease